MKKSELKQIIRECLKEHCGHCEEDKIEENGFFDDMDAANASHEKTLKSNPPLDYILDVKRDAKFIRANLIIKLMGSPPLKPSAEDSVEKYIEREMSNMIKSIASYNVRTLNKKSFL